jgi:peptidoglycan/LPS O-acetylase OafA/YrhL
VTPPAAPTAVRRAGLIVVVQGVAALVVAVVLVIRGTAGADQHVANGLATAGWFVLVGAGVIAAGRALILGRRWGRGLAVITQLLLLPVAWYLAVGSHQPGFGIPAGVVALIVLGLLFSPAAVRWAAGRQGDSASSANPGPDSR